MTVKTTQEKFVHELGDAYDAENQFLDAMQQLSSQASDRTLQSLVEKHIGETQQQIKTLEQVYSLLNEQPKRLPCDAAKGIVSEGQKTVKEFNDPALRDTVIGTALDKAEHYEIASYAGLKSGAEVLGNAEIVKLIDGIFEQEKKMSQELEKSAPKLIEKASKQTVGA